LFKPIFAGLCGFSFPNLRLARNILEIQAGSILRQIRRLRLKKIAVLHLQLCIHALELTLFDYSRKIVEMKFSLVIRLHSINNRKNFKKNLKYI